MESGGLVEFVSRFLPGLKKNGNEYHHVCVFCDSDTETLRVGNSTWRTLCCCAQDEHGDDASGFLQSFLGISAEEAQYKLGNGALPEPPPIEQARIRRPCFFGLNLAAKRPGIKLWIHDDSDATFAARELIPERVHLGYIRGRALDELGLPERQFCVLVPSGARGSWERMSTLAGVLHGAGHDVRLIDARERPWDWRLGSIQETHDEIFDWATKQMRKWPLTDNDAAQQRVAGQTTGLPDEPRNPELGAAAAASPNKAVQAGSKELDIQQPGQIAVPQGTTPELPAPSPATLLQPAPTAAGVAPSAQQPASGTAPKHAPAAPGRARSRANGAAGPQVSPAPASPEQRASDYPEETRRAVLASMVYRKASSVRMRATDWLWPGKIPLGEICVIQGDPGLGKSQITASLCAIITRGGQWPVTREPCDVGSVIVLSAEDSTAKTIVPRLAAAGADLDRVTILQSIKHEHGTRGFSLLADMLALDALLGEEDNPMAVIVDPISAYQDTVGNGAKTHDSHKNTDVRSLLRPVSELVDRRNVTMILINHLTKGAGRAITRGQGNMAFVAGPRAVWQVSKDKDEPRKRLFLPVKNNLADDSGETGLSFSVEPVDLGRDDQGKPIKTSRILWNDERVSITADEAAGYDSLSQDERGSVTDAQAFLAETLAEGRVKVKDVERLARLAGHSLSTLGRAKRAMGVLSEKEGFAADTVWYWALRAPNGSAIPGAEPPSWVKDD